jgi:hypothetical protein
MAKKLAFMTIGILNEPFGQPGSQGFVDRVPGAFAAADVSHGFVARSIRDMTTYQRSWGELKIPQAFAAIDDPLRLPSTLSIWDDLESVAAYAYHGAHGEALTKRKEWFGKPSAPLYVAWWMDEGDSIDPQDAATRFDHLHENGSSPFAFDFKKPFDADGNPCKIDQARVKDKISSNVTAWSAEELH